MDNRTSNFIEDATGGVQDVEDVLTDDELVNGGLAPVRAFVRTDASKNALRQRKAKDKKAAGEGGKLPAKQLNLTVPVDDASREMMKSVASGLMDGSLSPATFQQDLAFAKRAKDELAEHDVRAEDLGTALNLSVKANRLMNARGLKSSLMRKWLK